MRHRLSAKKVADAKPREKPYKLFDGGGLYLRMNPSGAASWRFKYRIARHERTYTIGSFPDVSLKEARRLHEEARALVTQGHHPLTHRRAADASSVAIVAQKWIAANAGNWSPGYRLQVERTISRNVLPAIGDQAIARVHAADLRGILDSMSQRQVPPGKKQPRKHGPIALALLLRQWLSALWRYAIAHGLAERNVADDLRGVLVRPKVRNNPGLTPVELGGLLRKLHQATASSTSDHVLSAIRLLVLTFVRSNELRQAQWHEFDLEKGVWTIPAARMKMRRPHMVPLSSQARSIVERLWEARRSNVYVFPNRRSDREVMSSTTINRALERFGYGGTLSAHGFRTTASTILHEQGAASHLVEKQLAHEARNRVAAIYNKAEFIEERSQLMQRWADYVEQIEGSESLS